MFYGTVDKNDSSRSIMIKTYRMEELDLSKRADDGFCIILIKSGSFTAAIEGKDYQFETPVILCLDERKQVRLTSGSALQVEMINFDPTFLNINMKIETIRKESYCHLCQQHAFFQMSPFLTEDIGKIGFRLSADTLSKIERSFSRMEEQLCDQPDWYWSCRVRSYFIDIINILERIFYNYYIENSFDSCTKEAFSSEFKGIVSYINNHLEEHHTLDSLYQYSRINKNQIEALFKEFMNMTFSHYLRQTRYEQACYYLRFTELHGDEIAARIGFSSSQNFCKFFRKMSGMTPNAFRREMLEKRRNDETLGGLRDERKAM